MLDAKEELKNLRSDNTYWQTTEDNRITSLKANTPASEEASPRRGARKRQIRRDVLPEDLYHAYVTTEAELPFLPADPALTKDGLLRAPSPMFRKKRPKLPVVLSAALPAEKGGYAQRSGVTTSKTSLAKLSGYDVASGTEQRLNARHARAPNDSQQATAPQPSMYKASMSTSTTMTSQALRACACDQDLEAPDPYTDDDEDDTNVKGYDIAPNTRLQDIVERPLERTNVLGRIRGVAWLEDHVEAFCRAYYTLMDFASTENQRPASQQEKARLVGAVEKAATQLLLRIRTSLISSSHLISKSQRGAFWSMCATWHGHGLDDPLLRTLSHMEHGDMILLLDIDTSVPA